MFYWCAPPSCTDLQRDHVWSELLPDAKVIHEELQHVKGLFLAHVQQQHSSHKADSLAVANLCGTKTNKQKKQCRVGTSSLISQHYALLIALDCGERTLDCGAYLCVQQRVGFQEVVEGKLPGAQLC